MKCEHCGSMLRMEDANCSYCGNKNPHYEKHRADMFRFQRDYEKTKEQVIESSGKAAKTAVKVTVIAVLLVLDIIMVFLASNAWEISHFIEQGKAQKNVELHRQRLEDYEKAADYIGFAKYYEKYSLYGIESLEEFNAVYRVCSSYAYVYPYLVELGTPDSYMTDEKRVEYISDNLKYIYEAMEPGEYDPKEWYEGNHQAMLMQMKYDLKVLLVAYAHVEEETAERFPDLSNGRRQVAMERGLGFYED